MRNGRITYFSLVLCLCACCLVIFSGCRAKKNSSRIGSAQTTAQSIAKKTDTSSVIAKTEQNMDETVSVHETTERETIHLDTVGRVRTIIRESVSKATGQKRSGRGSGSTVSVTGATQSDSTSITSLATSNEKIEQNTDSRPVQGVEWIWVFLSVSLVLSVAIYLIINRKK